MNEAVEPVRRGRPPNELKKGNSTWKPANILDIFEKEPGFRYRIAEKSPRNIAKKRREGWEVVSAINSPNTVNETGNYMDKANQQTSVLEGYDYVVMRIPEEKALERDAYFNGENSRRISALKRETSKGMDGKASVHGEITIEKKGIRNVIKE